MTGGGPGKNRDFFYSLIDYKQGRVKLAWHPKTCDIYKSFKEVYSKTLRLPPTFAKPGRDVRGLYRQPPKTDPSYSIRLIPGMENIRYLAEFRLKPGLFL